MRPLSAKKPKHLWQTVRRLLSYMGHYRLLLLANVRSPAVGGAGGEARIEQAGCQGQQGACAHLRALDQYVMHVPACRADVYEVRHEDGDHELEAGLDQYEGHAEKEVSPILVQTGEETLECSHP